MYTNVTYLKKENFIELKLKKRMEFTICTYAFKESFLFSHSNLCVANVMSKCLLITIN